MKKTMLFSLILAGMLTFGLMRHGQAQTLLLEENFSYTVGTALNTNGWSAHSPNANTIMVTTPTISYPGYLSSGIGSEVTLVSGITGEDVNKGFTSQTSGSVYAGFLVNVTSASAAGDYFFHLGPATIGTTFRGRIFVKKDASENLAFGITHTSSSAVAYTGFDYSLNTTYLIVLKYTFVSGTANDIAAIFINPVLGAAEPTPTVVNTDTPTDPTDIGSVALRQGGATTTPGLYLDGIRIGTTWADVTASGSVTTPTVQTSNFVFSNVLQTQMDVAWTNGDGTRRIVKINTSNSFTDPVNGTDPAANPVYGGGEQVIFNGTGNSVPTVSGLTIGTTYWFRAYEYNGTGTTTMYLTSAAVNNPTSQATASVVLPPVVSALTATGITATSAILGGNITADGGGPITERGTVWSTFTPVTIADNKLAEGGATTGEFSHQRTGMPVNTQIYYAAYATNSAGTTLSAELSFNTLLGEPTNHVADFVADPTSSSTILTTWLDNDGAQPATGYLILANKTGIFTDPVDGVPVANHFGLNDSSAAVNVNHGVQTYNWYGLLSNTQFFFKIYPYTNSGTNIDYKTTPDAATANATTLPYIPPVAAWTFDYTPASPNTPLTVEAGFGDQTGTAMLYADGTNGSSAWVQSNELNAFSGTTLNDPREGDDIFSGMSYCLIGGTGVSANGKSIVVKFSMSALQDAELTYATRWSSTTAFNSHQWAWSTDGVNFTDFGTNTAPTSTSFAVKTLDLSGITQINGAPVVYLRLTVNGATSSTSNNRLDNIVIHADAASNIPPTVETAAATNVDNTSATLNGTVNANNQASVVSFEYGTDNSYGTTVEAIPASVNGGATTQVSADITGLDINTTYHFRVIATNASGTTFGEDFIFTTACPLPADPGAISGETNVTANGSVYVYTVYPVMYATGYVWSIPPGSVIIAGDNTNSISLQFNPGAISGDISVFGTNDCGDGNANDPLAITVTSGPPVDRSVNGTLTSGMTECYDATGTITVAGSGTTFVVEPGASATMIAGSMITFLPGTSILSGGYLHGYIAPSGPWCNPPALAQETITGTETVIFGEPAGMIRIYPNPTNGKFFVERNRTDAGNHARAEVFSAMGNRVLTCELTGSVISELSVNGQPAGFYFVRVTNGPTTHTVKLIVTK